MRHSHLCHNCGHEWDHVQSPDWTHAEFEDAHSCANCGQRGIYEKYRVNGLTFEEYLRGVLIGTDDS